jgi:hypothetical protein
MLIFLGFQAFLSRDRMFLPFSDAGLPLKEKRPNVLTGKGIGLTIKPGKN